MVSTGHKVGVAIALTFAAGFATVLGGMVVFSKRLVQLANPVSLAVALSISSGVMIFISFVEIFDESVHLLTKGIKNERMSRHTATGHGWLIATVCCGAGILLIYGIDLVTEKLSPETESTALDSVASESHDEYVDMPEPSPQSTAAVTPPYVEATSPSKHTTRRDAADRRQLKHVGLLTALALGLHNLPEGIATYSGAIQDSSVGFSLALGIALHNIPEGIAVAAPIYFATGSRMRGIMWCSVAAVAQPAGGFIAWLMIGEGINPLLQGILFGIVCGIMVGISFKELIPTAYRFAKNSPHVVALGNFAGMCVMVASLILFGYAGV